MNGTPDSDHTLIARIDERTQTMAKIVTSIEQRLARDYVTQDEFKWVRNIVFGTVGTILISFIGSIIAIVIR